MSNFSPLTPVAFACYFVMSAMLAQMGILAPQMARHFDRRAGPPQLVGEGALGPPAGARARESLHRPVDAHRRRRRDQRPLGRHADPRRETSDVLKAAPSFNLLVFSPTPVRHTFRGRQTGASPTMFRSTFAGLAVAASRQRLQRQPASPTRVQRGSAGESFPTAAPQRRRHRSGGRSCGVR